MYYLCRRGRENFRDTKKTHFSTKIYSRGHLFLYQALDEEDKKHRADTSGKEPNTEGENI